MKYVLLNNGVVEQVQPYPAPGFKEAPDTVVAGQVLQTDGSYANPPPSPSDEKTQRTAEIIAELAAIDAASIRPLRAGESEKLRALEAQAQALRDEMKAL